MRRFLMVTAMVLWAGAAFAQGYSGIPDKFFGLIAEGRTSEAIDFLYATNPWIGKNSDQVMNLKAELGKLDGLVGKYIFHELIVEEKVGTRYAHLIYLVGYERQPLRFEIKVYKTSGQWRFQGVSFDARITDDIEKLANQKLAK